MTRNNRGETHCIIINFIIRIRKIARHYGNLIEDDEICVMSVTYG